MRAVRHEKLLSLVDGRVSDRRRPKLLRQWLPSWPTGVLSETVTGTSQGGAVSPLLADVSLHALDRAWAPAA